MSIFSNFRSYMGLLLSYSVALNLFLSPYASAEPLYTSSLPQPSLQRVQPTSINLDETALTVIGYHEVAPLEQALIADYAITPEEFNRHIDQLIQQNYHFVSVDQLIQASQHHTPLPSKPILLTFDDGYRSFYDYVYPVLSAKKIPAVLGVVGTWVESESGLVNFGDRHVAREHFLSWTQLRDMQASGLVEVASHSYNLHRGLLGNPQGNSEPAAVTREYFPDTKRYENDKQYIARITRDLKTNSQLLQRHGIKSPRVMVWPYGRYNADTVKIAKQLGMPITLTLDEGLNHIDQSVSHLNRILVERQETANDLVNDIQTRLMNLTDNDRPQKIMHVDLDTIYDKDPEQENRNLSNLLDRIKAMGITTVYLQAFADPDANGSADSVYFPNRYLPMREDLFNRVAWQIQSRAGVQRLYAWMPMLAWELPNTNPAAKDIVLTQQPKQSQHLNMGYKRLSPYSKAARQVIIGLYTDLAKSSTFDGILFHDDTTLSDYEDASPRALDAYAKAGLPRNLERIRANDQLLSKWTDFKIKTIDDFAMQLADTIRHYQPFLVTARNLYAQVALHPYAENWYSQSLEQSLNRYDFTAIMAMPYMEQVTDQKSFYTSILERVKTYPHGTKKTVFELQAQNWRTDQPIDSQELANTIATLYDQGALHIAYYPDDPVEGLPQVAPMKEAFARISSRFIP